MVFRALLAIAAYFDLDVEKMDVETAFLYGIIKERIYMKLPQGFEKAGIVCRLRKALYGLKQSARLWYERFAGYLFEKIGLTRLQADHGNFTTKDGIHGPMVSLWVDDFFLFFIYLFMFNVYVQPYGYDRPFVFPFPLTPSRLTPFFFSISALSRRLYCIVTVRPLGCLPS